MTSIVPALLAMMVRSPEINKYNTSSLRFVISTGASLAGEIGKEAEEKLGCPIIQHYGSNEAGVVAMCQNPDWPREIRLTTVGQPPTVTEVKIVDNNNKELAQGDVGGIIVRGPSCSYSYYKDRAATEKAWTKDGWYRMGDLGKFDQQGNLMIVGRERDMIIRGGQNIYPIEVENLLLMHPSISRVAIVKMPDIIMGEKACAYIVLKEKHQLNFEEMTAFLKTKKIASYKFPERLEIIDTLPLSQGQKIDKKVLEQDIVNKLKREGKL